MEQKEVVVKTVDENGASYSISNGARVEFVTDDIGTNAKNQANQDKKPRGRDVNIDKRTKLLRRLKTKARSNKSDSTRLVELDAISRMDFKLNLVNTLLLRLANNDKTDYTTDDLKEFLTSYLPGYGNELNAGGMYDSATIESIIESDTPDGMNKFLIDTLEDVIDTYSNIDETTLDETQTRERQIAASLHLLSSEIYTVRTTTLAGTKEHIREKFGGALKGDIINAVALHFKIPLLQKYEEEYYSKASRKPLRLYVKPKDGRKSRGASYRNDKLSY